MGYILDFIFLPLRTILPPEKVRRYGITPIVDERHNIVLKHTRGRLLDIGCGSNLLVKQHGDGVGVDVYPWEGIDILLDTRHLPFPNETFDTITFMASLNHIPNPIRKQVLGEAHRVLKGNGQILITMLTPFISYIGHNYLWGWRDPDIQKRGMKKGESWGFSPKQMNRLLNEFGLMVINHKRFVYGLNHLYVVQKK